eukprot:Skav212548  [mRNA]  locus=scaffold1851:616343:618831:+ [translate_table: standard]
MNAWRPPLTPWLHGKSPKKVQQTKPWTAGKLTAPAREGVALWQWCHELHVTPAQAEHLEDCFWGIYTEQQNRPLDMESGQATAPGEIEDAYQAAERQLEITVGVRRWELQLSGRECWLVKLRLMGQYQVVFGPAPGFARQEALLARPLGPRSPQGSCPTPWGQNLPATAAQDQRLRKRRLMRRRWLSESEFCARMTQEATMAGMRRHGV